MILFRTCSSVYCIRAARFLHFLRSGNWCLPNLYKTMINCVPDRRYSLLNELTIWNVRHVFKIKSAGFISNSECPVLLFRAVRRLDHWNTLSVNLLSLKQVSLMDSLEKPANCLTMVESYPCRQLQRCLVQTYGDPWRIASPCFEWHQSRICCMFPRLQIHTLCSTSSWSWTVWYEYYSSSI